MPFCLKCKMVSNPDKSAAFKESSSEFASVLGLSSNSEPYTPPQFDNNTTNKELLNKFVKDAREWEEKGDLEL